MTLHPGTVDPARTAAIFGDSRLSYGALDSQSRALAATLFARGLAGGDTVALLIGNRAEFLVAAWAAQRSGLYYLPLPTRSTTPELAYLLADSGARALIIDPAFAAAAYAALTDLAAPPIILGLIDWDTGAPEPATVEGGDMCYTSGSTGRPKGVRRALSGAPLGSDGRRVDRARALFGLGVDSIFLSPAPLYHAAPLRFAMNLLRTGGTVVGMPRFDAAEALRLIAAERVTHSQWVPTMFGRLLALDHRDRTLPDLSSHRVAVHAGAPCPPAVKRAMIDWWGPILHEYYSGTESIGFTHATAAEWLARPGTVGRAYGSTVHILDDAGRAVATGDTGRVFFAGSGGLRYHGDAAKTAAAHDGVGRATMGDLGYLDGDGYLFLTGRAGFTIITGGVNVYPAEIEAVLVSHPAVGDVAVFGVPDGDLGEAVRAVVEPATGHVGDAALAADLLAWARTQLAGPKLPRRIAFANLPRTATGKLARAEVRDAYLAGHDCGFAATVASARPA